MASYSDQMELKQAERLENAQRIGACLTCRYWDADGPRSIELAPQEALCLHPDLQRFQLIVSGRSGCNGWEEQPGLAPEAANWGASSGEA